jgi:hypothetical protein
VAPAVIYTLTAGTTRVAAGGALSVSWTSSVGGNDWVALFKLVDNDRATNSFAGWTEGATSGMFTLNAPLEAGDYEFRYFVDDSYQLAATSSVVRVAAGTGLASNRGLQ